MCVRASIYKRRVRVRVSLVTSLCVCVCVFDNVQLNVCVYLSLVCEVIRAMSASASSVQYACFCVTNFVCICVCGNAQCCAYVCVSLSVCVKSLERCVQEQATTSGVYACACVCGAQHSIRVRVCLSLSVCEVR